MTVAHAEFVYRVDKSFYKLNNKKMFFNYLYIKMWPKLKKE